MLHCCFSILIWFDPCLRNCQVPSGYIMIVNVASGSSLWSPSLGCCTSPIEFPIIFGMLLPFTWRCGLLLWPKMLASHHLCPQLNPICCSGGVTGLILMFTVPVAELQSVSPWFTDALCAMHLVTKWYSATCIHQPHPPFVDAATPTACLDPIDARRVVTPIRPRCLQLLLGSLSISNFLVSGICFGFCISHLPLALSSISCYHKSPLLHGYIPDDYVYEFVASHIHQALFLPPFICVSLFLSWALFQRKNGVLIALSMIFHILKGVLLMTWFHGISPQWYMRISIM